MFRKVSPQSSPHDYVEERLSAFIDGQLPEEERAQVRKHLLGCLRCQASLDSLGWTVKLLKQVPAPALPRQFTLQIPELQRRPVPRPWLKWGLASASAVAAFAFVFLVAVDLLSQPGSSPSSVAMPAAVPAHTTSVALAPTSAPPAGDRAAPPTSAPSQELATPAPPALSQAQATAAPPPSAAPSVREAVAPTESNAQPTTKQIAPTPTCEGGCGGGVGGGPPEETPQTLTIAAASPITTSGVVNDGPLAVRLAPSAKASRIAWLRRGEAVQILRRDETGDWLQILFPVGNDQGTTAWVMTKFVNLSVPVDSLPTAEPPTVTPTPPPGMTFHTPQGIQSPARVLAKSPPSATPPPVLTPSPTEASPPNGIALATATTAPAWTPTASTTLQPTYTPTTRLPPPTAATDQTPNSLIQDSKISALRLGQVAALLVSIVLGSAAFFLTRA